MSISILASVFSDSDLQSDRIKLPFSELVEELCQMFSTSFCLIKVPDDEMPAIFRLRLHLGDVVACKCKQCLPYRCIRVCLEVFNGADNHNYVLTRKPLDQYCAAIIFKDKRNNSKRQSRHHSCDNMVHSDMVVALTTWVGAH